MSLVVYADFTCPDCYLAARRCDALSFAGIDIDFRPVEHRRVAGDGHPYVSR